jgi:sigma-70-like protein
VRLGRAGRLAAKELDFDDLYRRYYPGVRGLIFKRVRDPQVADDLAQETFVRLIRFSGTLDPRRRLFSLELCFGSGGLPGASKSYQLPFGKLSKEPARPGHTLDHPAEAWFFPAAVLDDFFEEVFGLFLCHTLRSFRRDHAA